MGLVLREGKHRPCGHGAFQFLLFGAPARRAADGGLLGAAPLRGPLCTPPGPPRWVFHLPSLCEGCASFAAGASSLRSAISLRAAQRHHLPLRCIKTVEHPVRWSILILKKCKCSKVARKCSAPQYGVDSSENHIFRLNNNFEIFNISKLKCSKVCRLPLRGQTVAGAAS